MAEGDNGTSTPVEVPVTLNTASASPVTVSWETTFRTDPGFASVGDFEAASGTVTFEPGETTKTVTVTVLGDDLVEPDENIVIRFFDPEGATLGGFFGLGFGLITNDD